MPPTKIRYAQRSEDREVLTSERTYWVSTTGSNSNNGLTSGTSFLTIQKAIDVASTLDNNGYDITIKIADGTYVSAASINLKDCVGSGYIIIQGNTGTPANVVVSFGASMFGFRAVSIKTKYQLKGIKSTGSDASSGSHISIEYGSYCEVSSWDFGAGSTSTSYCIQAIWGGNVQITSNLTISGNNYIAFSARGSGIIFCYGRTITMSGSPVLAGGAGWLLNTYYSGTLIFAVCTVTGTCTGVKYYASLNGVIYQASTTYPVGLTAGASDTGGQVG